jgi:hypothetical protein
MTKKKRRNMLKYRRFIVFILTICLIGSVTPFSASAASLPSAWAENELELARQWGLLDARADTTPGKPFASGGWSGLSWNNGGSYHYGGFYGSGLQNPESYTAGISKDTLCQIAVTMCEKLLGRSLPVADVRFSDEGTPGYYYRAYAAGIVGGSGITDDGAVIPGRDEALSREQIAKMLYKAIVYCYPAETFSGSADTAASDFADGGSISSWALEAAAYMLQRGIMKGVDGSFLPQDTCTFEQGVVLAKRIYERFQSDAVLGSAPMLKSGLEGPIFLSPESGETSLCIQNGLAFQWQAVPGAARYLVRLVRPGDFEAQYFYTDSTEMELEPRRYQEITPGLLSVSIAAVDSGNTVISPFSRLDLTLYNDPDYYFDFSGVAEAAQYMQTVTVKVWDIGADGIKVTKEMKLTVHKWVAQDVLEIFDEIYNGPEQFPIHAVGGYRSGTGEHGKGTAVDINWNENYEIYNDGRITCGTLWEPGVNPYSIPLDGDVVRAFRARGWGWGGTDWSRKQDYMHFSYFGT